MLDNPDVQLLYQEKFMLIDPAPAAMAGLAVGKAASTDILFRNTMDRCAPFIEGFLHPLDLAGTSAGIIANEGGKTGFLGLHRARARRSFDEHDIARLEIILPHLVNMLKLRRMFYEMEERVTFLTQAIELVGMAVLVLDSSKCLLYANAQARHIFSRKDGLELNYNGELIARDPAANRALRRLRGDSRTNVVLLVPRTDAAQPYGLRIVTAEGDQSFRAQGGFFIVISDPTEAPPGISDQLAHALGLTKLSARLVSAMMQGETLGSYALKTGISRSTAKYHLQSAFASMDVNRQPDLIRKIIRYIYDLS